MKNNSSSNSSGLGLAGVLTVVFVVLKLLDVIQWSWLWVLSPLWIELALALLIWGGFLIYALCHTKKHGRRKRDKWKF